MQIMSPEVYQQVWFVFPLGVFVFVTVLQILKIFFGSKITYVFSLIMTLCLFIFLWNKIGLNIGTYLTIGFYILFGFGASFGGSGHHGSRARSGGGGGSSNNFSGGSSGGGGSSGSW